MWARTSWPACATSLAAKWSEYGKLLSESREQALDRMKAKAEKLGANAVTSLQFQTSIIMDGAAEMMAYGTAVVIEDE